MEIKIILNNDIELQAELYETETARKVFDSLPIKARGSTWGEEIYFSTDIVAPEENAVEVVDAGDVAYWPPMQALCFFYGPTPASQGDEIRAAGPVNVIGKIKNNITPLKKLQGNVEVSMDKIKS